MTTFFANPAVEGQLGKITKNIKVLTADINQPVFTASKSAAYTAELALAGVLVGEVVHVTWLDNKVDFCLVIDDTGTKLHKFALGA